MADGFRLRVFGPPALVDGDGRAVRFRTKKQLALLVFLHFEARNHPVAREGLVELLWPEVNADKGRHSLSQALSAVRAHLGEGSVSARTDTVGLVAPLLTELDQLGAGAGEVLDVADPLRDLDTCAGADFAHWVDSARERLHSAARERLAAGLREARSRGDLAGVARLAALLHRVDPVSPAATIALAERALLDGDTIGAIRMLRDYVRRVEQELGGNPHPEIANLLRRLEQGGGPAIESSTPLAHIAQRRREVFVGRETELARLEGLWQRGREESLVSCLVTGVAGIGKSSLVRRLATSVAARTNPVFVVTCQEIGGGIPFAAVSDLMLAIGRDPAAGGTEPLWLAEASRVSPGLRALYPGIPEPPQAPAESVRLRVAEALVRMIESVAERRSVLIVFDDVQHMDPASRDVMFLFARRLDQLHVVLIGTLRTDEGNRALPSETQAETLGWQEQLELERLDDAQLLTLIQELTNETTPPAEGIRNTIASLAQGNPYHAEMLLADWRQHSGASLVAAKSAGDPTAAAWKPPETLRLAFARQYRGLSADGQHVLHVLAVAGKALSSHDIADLVRIEPALAERTALELIDRSFVRVDGGRFCFKNELHRAFVYYAMAIDARRYYHTRLAQASWERRDANDFQWALEASHHFVRAGMPEDGLEAASLGAELALARGAPHEASTALQTLLQAYPQDSRSMVHLLLARAQLAGGDYDATLIALAKWSESGADPANIALAAGVRAAALHRGRLADDRAIMEAARVAARLAEEASAEETLAGVLQIQAEAAFDQGDFAAITRVREIASLLAAETDVPQCRAIAGVTRGFTALAAGELQASTRILSETARLLDKLGLHEDHRRVLNGLGISWTRLGFLQKAESAFQRALVVAERLGNPVLLSNTWANLGSLYQDFGMFSQAVEASHQVLRTLTPSTVRSAGVLYNNMAGLALSLGNLSEAEQYCQESEKTAERSYLWSHAAVALMQRADLCLARSMPEFAWPFVERTLSIVSGREWALSDLGQFFRLKIHFVWATKGYANARPLALHGPVGCGNRVADMLEVEGFVEWLRFMEGDDADVPARSALSAIESAKMFGVLARLIAVGTPTPGIPKRSPGESSAQLVARLFPAPERALVPHAVGLDKLTDELQRSA